MNLGSPLTPATNDRWIDGEEQAAMRMLSPLQHDRVEDG